VGGPLGLDAIAGSAFHGAAMSMIGHFRRASDEKIGSLFSDPETIDELLDDDGGDGDDDRVELRVDKAWHGIHYLLTGTAWEGSPPLDFIAKGGREVGDVDVGYGPARAFSSADVRAIATALLPIARADLEKRFDPAAMMDLDVYPAIWDRPREQDDTLEYLLVYYDALKAFIAGAAERGEGLLVYLT
jgi:hypothetical protein